MRVLVIGQFAAIKADNIFKRAATCSKFQKPASFTQVDHRQVIYNYMSSF